jgi:hypothetical protein
VEIKADFDPGTVMRLLDDIERKTEELRAELPLEFAAWQNDDMNRKQAQTRTLDVERPSGNFTRASTFINPTSRYRVKKRRRVIRKLKKTGQQESIRTSSRPVLRASLIEDFKQRFRELLDRAF